MDRRQNSLSELNLDEGATPGQNATLGVQPSPLDSSLWKRFPSDVTDFASAA